MKTKRVLITGCSGMPGSALAHHLNGKYFLIGLYQQELLLNFLVWKYMFTLPREFVYFIISISLLFSISALFSIFHGFLGSTTLNPWLFAVVSLVTQAMIRSFILNVFYKNYFPRDKVVNFAKDLYELGTAEIRRKLKAISNHAVLG